MTKPNHPQKGQTKSSATKAKMSTSKTAKAQANNNALSEVIDNAMSKDVKTGRFISKVADAEWEWAIERLAAGDSMRNVCAHLQVTRYALMQKAIKDTKFKAMLDAAIDYGGHAMVDNALDAAWGGDCSTGSIERDKLVVQMVQWYAARRSRKAFGDRQEIDVRTVQITLDKDDVNWF